MSEKIASAETDYGSPRSTRNLWQRRVRNVTIAANLWMIALVASPQPVSAQASLFSSPLQKNAAVQEALIFSGHYDGLADGTLGPHTAEAVKAFQRQTGAVTTGDLTDEQQLKLFTLAREKQTMMGFAVVSDAFVGAPLAIPLSIFSKRTAIEGGVKFARVDGTAEIVFVKFAPGETLDARYQNSVAHFSVPPKLKYSARPAFSFLA